MKVKTEWLKSEHPLILAGTIERKKSKPTYMTYSEYWYIWDFPVDEFKYLYI